MKTLILALVGAFLIVGIGTFPSRSHRICLQTYPSICFVIHGGR